MSVKLENLLDIATTQPDRLIKYRVSDDGLQAEVLLPGLWYTDFDKKIGGKLTIWAIAKLYESIRYSVLNNGFGLFDRLKDDDHSIFMASVTYNFTRKVNTVLSMTHWGKTFPVLAKLHIVHIGNSSFTFDCNLYDHGTGEELMTGLLTFVYVDYRTRKPASFPPWMGTLKKSKQFIQLPERIPTPNIPEKVFTYDTQAFSSDIDVNGHVNQSIFLKWCADAGADAALKGHYPAFTKDIGKYPNQKISLKYIGEGMQGDKFVVHTWQDERDFQMLHFVITRMGKKVFVARFTYYSNDVNSKM